MPERVQEEKMARQKLNSEPENLELTLEDLVSLYGRENEQLKEQDKIVKELNSDIKQKLHEQDIKELTANGWKVSLVEQDRSTMNEDRLLDIAHQNGLDVVKTKEYIDYDALESLIYNGKVPQDVIQKIGDCKEVKIIETLRITKVKEKN